MTAPFEIKDIGWRRADITPSVACGDTSLEEGGGKQDARPESSQGGVGGAGTSGSCRSLRQSLKTFMPKLDDCPALRYYNKVIALQTTL